MEYPIESTSSQPQSYYANNMDQEYHSNDAGIDFNALSFINAMDLETDSDLHNKIMAATPSSVPLSNEALGDTLHLNDEIFFENQANGDYKYNFTHPSGSASTSSSPSSIPLSNATLGTPDLSVPVLDKVATFPPTPQLNYNDRFFQNQLSTSQMNQSPDQNRHNSTTIPVDQLNLLSIKSLGTNTTSVPNYYYTTNNSRTDENEFNYNLNLALENLNKDVADFGTNPPIEQNQEPTNNISQSIGTASIGDSSESINGRGRDSERTINPRKLFTSSNKILTSMSSPALTTLFAINNSSSPSSSTANANQQYKDTPSSMPVPKIPSLPNQSSSVSLPVSNGVNLNNLLSRNQYRTPKFDFKMNDECYNAISYWLNNTLQTVRSEDDLESSDPTDTDDATKIMVNPTGIIKGNYQSFSNTTSTPTVRNRPHSFSSHGSYGGVSKRRNSLQMSNPSVIPQQAIINDLENRQVDEDIDNSEFATSPSSSMVPPSKSYVLPAGQKKNTKRRKSSNTYESPSKLASDFSKLEASMNYAPLIQFDDSRRKCGSSPTNVETEGHNQDKNKINDVLTMPSSSTVAQNSQGAFLCTECDKQFKRSEHLKRHVRSVHSNIRPFLCKYCDKKFSRSDNLAQHSKTHYRVDSSGQTTILNASSSNRVGSTGGRGRKD